MISINSSEKTYVNISVNKTDSGQNNTYRFHYVNYTHSKIISLVDSRIFTFETYENLIFETSNYSNSPYYLSNNK